MSAQLVFGEQLSRRSRVRRRHGRFPPPKRQRGITDHGPHRTITAGLPPHRRPLHGPVRWPLIASASDNAPTLPGRDCTIEAPSHCTPLSLYRKPGPRRVPPAPHGRLGALRGHRWRRGSLHLAVIPGHPVATVCLDTRPFALAGVCGCRHTTPADRVQLLDFDLIRAAVQAGPHVAAAHQ
jgi:hypothetical protein